MMTDETQRVPGVCPTADDRADVKRKCDDFTALYPLDTTASQTSTSAPPRTLADSTGKYQFYISFNLTYCMLSHFA